MLSSTSSSTSTDHNETSIEDRHSKKIQRKIKKNSRSRSLYNERSSKSVQTDIPPPNSQFFEEACVLVDSHRSQTSSSSSSSSSVSYSIDEPASSSSSSEDDASQRNVRNELYKNAQLTVAEFNVLFQGCVGRMALPEAHCETLLNFVRLILPLDNNLPLSYRRIKKVVNDECMEKTVLCSICFSELNDDKRCSSETCSSHRKEKFLKTTVCVGNVKKQIEYVINANREAISSYRGNIFLY